MTSVPSTLQRLPPWLAPRDSEAPGPDRRRRLIEGAVLVAIGLLLAAAVIRDVVRQVGVDDRVVVDKRTWVHYTHHNIKLVSVLTNTRNNIDFACGPPHAHATYRVCLMLTGGSHGTYRHISGGYRLGLTGFDVRANRYDCFGLPRHQHLCPRRGVVR